uniref:Ferritin-like domain-containing protein n=1 Tax=Roseihalotalea indica TaxID=2867963 RepID=A0AA49GMD3_9BACT|nr:ferritin-like domain-containing protein [Tunicatimonas sp. TK19036]
MFTITSKPDGQTKPEGNQNRRSFLKYGGATLATAGIVFSGCKEIEDLIPKPPKDKPKEVNLGSGDIGILNYAYTLEQLEAAFYEMVMLKPYHDMTFEEALILEDLKRHEVIHREFYKKVLGKDAIAELEFDFSSIDFSNRHSVLNTARTFEDLGVAAYNGAGRLLESADLLLIAGKIVSVEARHAAAIKSVADDDPTAFAGDDVIDENGLGQFLSTNTVLESASAFIKTDIDGTNLPKP